MGKKKFIDNRKAVTFELAQTLNAQGKPTTFLKPRKSDFKSHLTPQQQLDIISRMSDLQLLKEYRKVQRQAGKKQEEREEKAASTSLQESELQGLDERQRELMRVVLPANYRQLALQGVEMRKFDQMGFPLDDGYDYSQHVFKRDSQPVMGMRVDLQTLNSHKIVDTDIDPKKMGSQDKELLDCLDDQKDSAYENLEDDFFIKLMGGSRKPEPARVTVREEGERVVTEKKFENGSVMKIVLKKGEEEEEDWEDDEDDEEEQEFQQINQQQFEDQEQQPEPQKESEEISDQDLLKALRDFDHSTSSKVMTPEQQRKYILFRNIILQNAHKKEKKVAKSGSAQEQLKEILTQSSSQQEQQGGVVQFREMTRKEKRKHMKSGEVWQPFKDARQREIKEKGLDKVKGVDPSEFKLRQQFQKIPFELDHLAQKTLLQENDSTVITRPTKQFQDDILSYHQKTSVVFDDLNVIAPTRKPKLAPSAPKSSASKPPLQEQEPQTVKKGKAKRKKEETSAERRERKAANKQEKRQRRTVKKEVKEGIGRAQPRQEGGSVFTML